MYCYFQKGFYCLVLVFQFVDSAELNADYCISPFPEVAESVQQELESYRAQEDEVKRLKSIMVSFITCVYFMKSIIGLVEMPSLLCHPTDKNFQCMLNFRYDTISKVELEVPYFMRSFNFLFIAVAIV